MDRGAHRTPSGSPTACIPALLSPVPAPVAPGAVGTWPRAWTSLRISTIAQHISCHKSRHLVFSQSQSFWEGHRVLPSTDFNNDGHVASCSMRYKARVQAQPQ